MNQFSGEFPAEYVERGREMEDWWDHVAGGWSPDKVTDGKK